MMIFLLLSAVALGLLAVLVGCLLHLTPRAFKGETRWQRIKRSIGAKQAMGGNPRARSGKFDPHA